MSSALDDTDPKLPPFVLQEALERLLPVEEEGGVTVRRDGNGKLKRWQYGYR